jgi:GTP cyclohydrolase-4
VRYYLGLGANLGDRRANLAAALRRLGAVGRVVAVSSLWQTAPVGPPGQPPYLNAAVALDSGLAPRTLLAFAKRVEWELGRRPGPVWGPRPLDIDILLADGARVDEPGLVVPHPRMAERGFVLWPLAEIAPAVVHPTLGRTVALLRDAVGGAGVERIAGPEWAGADYPATPSSSG